MCHFNHSPLETDFSAGLESSSAWWSDVLCGHLPLLLCMPGSKPLLVGKKGEMGNKVAGLRWDVGQSLVMGGRRYMQTQASSLGVLSS